MARILLGPSIGEIRGKVGGGVYSRNRFGNYLRMKTSPVNPNTSRQNAVRSIFSTLATEYKDTVTNPKKEAWNEWGSNSPITSNLGTTYNPTGINAYIGINALLMQAGQTPITEPPSLYGEEAPCILSAAGFACSEATQDIAITANADIAGFDASTDDDLALIYMGSPQNPNVSFFNGPYRYCDVLIGDSVAPLAFPTSSAVPFEFVEGQRIWIKIIHISPERRKSPPSIINILAVA